jgi:hypothetical protein
MDRIIGPDGRTRKPLSISRRRSRLCGLDRSFSPPLSFSPETPFAWFSPPRRRAGPAPLTPAMLAGVGKGKVPEVVVGVVFV